MDAKISAEFWSDPAIENMSPEQKLAALWVMTSSRTTIFGFVEVSKKRFEFETGLSFEALEQIIEAHAKGFRRVDTGIWIRRFIAHQIGTGNQLIKNNFCKALVRELRAYEGLAVHSLVLEEYPEIKEVYHSLFPEYSCKGLSSPSSGLQSPGEEKSREEKRGEECRGEETIKDPLLNRACDIFSVFRNDPSRPLDSTEQTAWKKNKKVVRVTSEEDWQVLEWFYAINDRETYRRGSLSALLNTWNGEITKGKDLAEKMGVTFRKKAPEHSDNFPADWKEILSSADPEINLPEHWEQLPESLRRLVREIEKNKKEGVKDECFA